VSNKYYLQIPANAFRFLKDKLTDGEYAQILWIQLDYEGDLIPHIIFKNGKFYCPIEAVWNSEELRRKIIDILKK